MPKDWKVGLEVVGDEIFQSCQNSRIGRLVFGTLGDALISKVFIINNIEVRCKKLYEN